MQNFLTMVCWLLMRLALMVTARISLGCRISKILYLQAEKHLYIVQNIIQDALCAHGWDSQGNMDLASQVQKRQPHWIIAIPFRNSYMPKRGGSASHHCVPASCVLTHIKLVLRIQLSDNNRVFCEAGLTFARTHEAGSFRLCYYLPCQLRGISVVNKLWPSILTWCAMKTHRSQLEKVKCERASNFLFGYIQFKL